MGAPSPWLAAVCSPGRACPPTATPGNPRPLRCERVCVLPSARWAWGAWVRAELCPSLLCPGKSWRIRVESWEWPSHLWKLQPREKGRFVQKQWQAWNHTYLPVRGCFSCFFPVLHFFTVLDSLEASGAATCCRGSLITHGPDHCALSQPLSSPFVLCLCLFSALLRQEQPVCLISASQSDAIFIACA